MAPSVHDLSLLERRICGFKAKRTAVDAETYVASNSEPLNAYACPFGDHWHVGHLPTRNRRKVIRKALRYLDRGPEVKARG